MGEVQANFDKECKDCKGKSVIVLDHSSGDLVCTGCGLVLEERCFDVGAEWRNFAPETVGSGNDVNARQRGDIMSGFNSMLEELNLSTSLAGSGAEARNLQRTMRQVEANAKASEASSAAAGAGASAGAGGVASSSSSKTRGTKRSALDAGALEEGSAAKARVLSTDVHDPSSKAGKMVLLYTNKSREVAKRLFLGENVVNRCTAFLQDLAKRGALEPNKRIGYFCALVHLASREEGATRSARELAVANVDAYRKTARASARAGAGAADASAAPGAQARAAAADKLESQVEGQVKDLTKLLCLAKPVAYVQDEAHMQRLVARLELSPSVAAYALHLVQEAYRQGSILGSKFARTSQEALMAASVFIAAWLMDVPQKPSFVKVASFAKAPEATVRAAYSLVLPALGYLLPRDVPIRLPGGVRSLPPAR